ncbi:MAG: tyrosine-type recombinase/integrase [Nitrospirae bacterium]|nr:tyrosine-type recombinase/integrase [Nitrospirota bacterium]
MEIDELKKEPLIIEWFANIEAAEHTRRNFLQGMRYYTNFIKKTPNELLEEAENEIKNGILMRKRKIRGYILTFREWLKGREYAPKTIHNHIVAVKSFYKSFDIDLPQLNSKKQFSTLATEENSRRLEKEDIKEVLKYANVRNRAIILTLASSGLSQSDLLDLTVGNFKKGLDEKTMIITLQLRRIKTRYDFITFLSPEATKAVLDYLEYRDRRPKNPRNQSYIIAWEKRRIRSDGDYLFCSSYIPGSYLETFDEKERRLTPEGLMDMFRELAKKAGLDTEKGQWQIVRAHNLRKFFNSQLLNNGADIFFTDFLMGHKIDSVHEAYFRADPKKLKDRYMRYLPYLALTDTETYIIETEEYTNLKVENQELRKQIQEIKYELDSQKDLDKSLSSELESRIEELIEKRAQEILESRLREINSK